MALKKTVTADEHKKLPADIQKEYKTEGDGFILDLEGGFEDTSALKRAKDHEKKEAADAKRALKEAQEALEAMTAERDGMLSGTIPKADLEKLKTSYDAKIVKLTTDRDTALASRDAQLSEMLVTNVATSLASELFTAPAIGLPHVAKRLKSEFKDGKMVTVVLDADGKPTDLTPADLKKEILANKDFASILTASKGSGGGANGNQGGGGAPKKIDFATATPKEIAAYHKEAGTIKD